MKNQDKIFNFRHELLVNLENIVKTSDCENTAELYKMELDYLKKVLFESRELENLLGESENE